MLRRFGAFAPSDLPKGAFHAGPTIRTHAGPKHDHTDQSPLLRRGQRRPVPPAGRPGAVDPPGRRGRRAAQGSGAPRAAVHSSYQILWPSSGSRDTASRQATDPLGAGRADHRHDAGRVALSHHSTITSGVVPARASASRAYGGGRAVLRAGAPARPAHPTPGVPTPRSTQYSTVPEGNPTPAPRRGVDEHPLLDPVPPVQAHLQLVHGQRDVQEGLEAPSGQRVYTAVIARLA